MLVRIIPCLDIRDGRVVKGMQFKDIKDAGDAINLAQNYDNSGASELMLLNIASTYSEGPSFMKIVESIAQKVSIPLIVGGGINDLDDIKAIKDAGANKVTLGTSAIKKPELIERVALEFGSSSIVVSIDAKEVYEGRWYVFINGGRINTDMDAIDWARKAADLGAGEILLTSMDRDGVRDGYDISLTRRVKDKVEIPVIASGGAGVPDHFLEVIQKGKADAVLAASLFHYGDMKVQELKEYLLEKGIEVK